MAWSSPPVPSPRSSVSWGRHAPAYGVRHAQIGFAHSKCWWRSWVVEVWVRETAWANACGEEREVKSY